MKKFLLLLTGILVSLHFTTHAQDQKKPLDFSVYDDWKYIEDKSISNDGNWVFYEVNPYEGDGKLYLWGAQNKETRFFSRATKGKFSPESGYLVFMIKPHKDTVREMKFNKVSRKKLPKDSLGIYILSQDKLIKKERIKSFKVADENSGWMAYQHEKAKPVKDTTEKKKNHGKTKKADKSAPEGTGLTIFNPLKDKQYNFSNISEYTISKGGDLISFIKIQNDSILKSTIYTFDTKKEKLDSVFSELGLSKKITVDHSGGQVAFIHSEDSVKTKVYSLYFWDGKEAYARKLVDTLTPSIPEKWTVGEHGRITFSENDERLFFGTKLREVPEAKDTLLDEEKVKVDVWNWKDPLLQPQQLKNVSREKRRTYLAVYHIDDNKIVQLADEKVRNIQPILKGNGDLAIGADGQPYQKLMSWEMPPYKDIYLVNMENGSKELIKEKIQSDIDISPSGKYFYWYSYADSCWHTMNINTRKTVNLTKGLNVNFYDEEHDYPNDPDSYRDAGWTEDDEHFLVYDRYDIWKLDPEGEENPVNMTQGYGRKNNIRFRYIRLDRDQEYINPKEDMLLSAFDEDTKASGYFITDIKGKDMPEKLIMDDFRFYRPMKAENADQVIWQKSSVQEYPNVWYSSMDFKDGKRISDANPQQKNYIWGTVELVEWITSEGTVEEGLLYKPENFNPNKKYPMMVYFYRLYSDRLHSHRTPKPSRSTINPIFYASNGYLVFIPNIRYKTGYPGESAYNYIVSGTNALLNTRSYIDKDKLAIQGQSWGGYQVAHIITKTDMYAAASAGAPVSNMTSAYGGIRWGSGMSRMFQYEETQSRIGGTLWEKPLHYIENSPVFYAPKVNTPLLMRHNDADGAVPWYQGIEYFVALRRLGKPVWMLNYNGEPHNERAKSPNCKDLSIRMKQFFDHYLLDKPAPVWMEKGIPATKKGETMGYELME